jgi:hypothetical protein
MPYCLEPKLDVLPAAQKEIWTNLAPASHLNFVLYGGTAIALHLGHRESLDFDFFRSDSLDKDQIRARFQFVRGSAVLQDSPETLVILAEMPAGSVKVSFFGGIAGGVPRRSNGDQVEGDAGSRRSQGLSGHSRDDFSRRVIAGRVERL